MSAKDHKKTTPKKPLGTGLRVVRIRFFATRIRALRRQRLDAAHH
jgi:hypothetical protein